MGCDIHIVVAKHENGETTILWDPDAFYEGGREHTDEEHDEHWKQCRLACNRNYERFARLSGVRGDGPEPNGWPRWMHGHLDLDSEDLHSHTHYTIHDAVKIFMETEYSDADSAIVARANPYAMYFHIDPAEHNLDNVWVMISYDN